MKKIFATMLAAMTVFAACQNEKEATPKVSFASPVPVIADGTAEFTIATADYAGTTSVSVPVTLGGDAVEGVDYTISAKEFVVGGETPVTKITVTSLTYGSGKKVTLTLNAPAGWALGQFATSEFSLADKLGWLSFEGKTANMTDKVVLTMGVYDGEGKALTLSKGDEIEVEVDTEKSTAVEGEQFSFAGEKKIVVAAGANQGTIILNMIGDAVVAEKDEIVLKLKPGAKYEIGNTDKITVKIVGAEWNRLGGTWQVIGLERDAAYMEQMWSSSCTGYDKIPDYSVDEEGVMANANDKIVIDMEAGTFTPSFTSTFKDYFIGVSNLAFAGKMNLPVGFLGMPAETMVITLDNTNRYFSPTEFSDDKVSYVGIKITRDSEQNDILTIYTVDNEPKTWMPEIKDFLGTEKPVAAAWSDIFMTLNLKRVSE